MRSLTLITQRDVALACGVHPSTICLALGNSPTIPPSTRQRIRETAEKLGYRPNAAARNLAYLRSDKSAVASLPIAWINQEPTRDFWHRSPDANFFWASAQQQAGRMGYHLDEFWIHEPGMSLGRLGQIIRARGIEAVVFPVYQQFDLTLLQPAWLQFSTVSFNDYRVGDWLDAVCADYCYNTDLVLAQLRHRGYKRAGLALSTEFETATNGLVHSRYLRDQLGAGPPVKLPVCILAGDAATRLRQMDTWYRLTRPDTVITDDPAFRQRAQAKGWPVKIVQWGGILADIDQRPALVAATAIDWLVGKARRFERGFGQDARRHLIKGAWADRTAHEAVGATADLPEALAAG